MKNDHTFHAMLTIFNVHEQKPARSQKYSEKTFLIYEYKIFAAGDKTKNLGKLAFLIFFLT